MTKKKSIKRANPNQRKNLLEKVSSRAKNNLLIVAIILFTSGIIYFREILSSFNYLKKEILYVYSTYISDKAVDQDNELRYLVFNGKQNFELWHKEVIKLLGLPKHARTYSNDEISKDVKVSEYTRMIFHPNPHDRRVMCVFDSDVPQILINEDAEIQYSFIKASHFDLEDMGFFFDDLTIQFDHEYYVRIPEIEEINKDYKYFEPKNLKSRKKLNELNFLALLELRKNRFNRNYYIMDYGSSLNKNRISLFVDENNLLNYRLIDSNGFSCLVKFEHELFDKLYQYNFNLGSDSANMYIEIFINGKEVFSTYLNQKIVIESKGSTAYLFANIQAGYCFSGQVIYAHLYADKNGEIISGIKEDPQNIDSVFIYKGKVIKSGKMNQIMPTNASKIKKYEW